MFKRIPTLHQALIDDDLTLFEKEKDNPISLLTKDASGFTAKELALLLGKIDLAIQLGYQEPPHITVSGIDKKVNMPLKQFEKSFGIQFIPTLSFPNYSALLQAIKECPLTFRLLPGAFAKKWHAKEASLSVGFIDDEIGFGLFAENPLLKGDFIGEYAGIVSKADAKADSTYMLHYPTRFFSYNPYVIDAKASGNLTRFINHSETPNLSPEFYLDRGLVHVAFYANRKILAGEELTVDYGKDYWAFRS